MSTRDDALESALRRIAADADPVPDLVVEAARAAWEVRALDAELADLVADSWADDAALTTRTLVSDVRMLSFEVGGVVIEVDLAHDALTRTVRLHAFAAGAQGPAVVVRPGGRTEVPLVDGHLELEGLPLGPVRLEVAAPDGRRVTTAWFVV